MGIFAIKEIIDKQVIEISKILDKDEGCCSLTRRMNTKFVLGELKEKYVKNEKDNKQTLLTEHCESFAFWLGMSCGNKGLRMNGDAFELMWYIIDEAKNLYEGIDDERLPLYTTKQIMKKYFDSYITNA